MAVVQNYKKVTFPQLIGDMTGEGSILKDIECNAVAHGFFKALGKRLQNGEGLISEYLIIDHSISGVFNDEEDQFDPERHQINVNIRLGSFLAAMVANTPVQKIKSSRKMPVLEQFRDLKTKTVNDRITPGSFAEISGSELKIEDPDDVQQGIFFIDSAGAEVRVAEISNNIPSKLLIEIPDALKKGEYALEVRSVWRNTKQLRKGRLAETLVVA